MSKFLFAPMPFSGHVNPGLPIARELVSRGHDVRWYSTPRFRRAIEETGARYVPFRRAKRLDEAALPEMFPDRPKEGIRQLQYDIPNVFIDFIPHALRDIEEEMKREPVDVIVGENTSAVCGIVSELHGTPWAVYGILPLGMPSRDTAPFGLGILPRNDAIGRLRNRALYWLVDNVIFRAAGKRFQEVRREVGLAQNGVGLFDYAARSDVYLQSTVASFEYPRTDMPTQVRFVGAPIPQPPAGWTPPAWWKDMEGRRVILVTQGTINNDYDQLIRPAIRALANDDALVIVTTGSKPADAVEIDPLPSNVRVEKFLPYAHLMPKVDLLLTNGGYGSIQIALAHGVPVVAIGKTEDKPEIANRVNWSGVGVGLKVRIPTEGQIRNAVEEVASNPSYRKRAEQLAKEMAGLDAAKTSAELLEELAGMEKTRAVA
jgi:MGT family glycosyltransferase